MSTHAHTAPAPAPTTTTPATKDKIPLWAVALIGTIAWYFIHAGVEQLLSISPAKWQHTSWQTIVSRVVSFLALCLVIVCGRNYWKDRPLLKLPSAGEGGGKGIVRTILTVVLIVLGIGFIVLKAIEFWEKRAIRVDVQKELHELGLARERERAEVAQSWHGLRNAKPYVLQLNTEKSVGIYKQEGLAIRWMPADLPGLEVYRNGILQEGSPNRISMANGYTNYQFRLSGINGLTTANLSVAVGVKPE